MMYFPARFLAIAAAAAVVVVGGTTDTQKPLQSGDSDNPFTDEFAKYVYELLDRWHVPSITVAVVDGDKTYSQAYGYAHVASKTPATPHTLYFVCSTTKAFTGVTVAHLIDTGAYKNPSLPSQPVDWKTPLSQILPDDFVLQDPWATAYLTFEDALTHRSGLPRHDETYGGVNASVQTVTRSLRHLPLSEPPRTKFQYCNMMFIVASHAIERLTGRWLGDVIKEWIWAPLGMNETFFAVEDAQAAGAHVATGYYWDDAAKKYEEVPYMHMAEVSGAGAIVSNVLDYATWLRALINEDKFVSKAVHATIKAPRIFDKVDPGYFDTPTAYALGWNTASYKGHRFWKHDGGADAWGANVQFMPGLKFGVVTLGNHRLSANVIGELLVAKLVDDKIKLPQDKRGDREADWRERLDNLEGQYDRAVDILFPDRPKKSLKSALPLKAYTGTYSHPAARNLTISLDLPKPQRRPNAKLGAERPDATWQLTGELEHVSGEFWVMYSHMTNVPVGPLNFSPIEFQLAADGTVAAVTLEFGNAPRGKGDGPLTFQKIA